MKMKTPLLTAYVTVSLLACVHAAELGCLYPAGGAPGTSFDVSVRGQALKMASGALISGSGVEAALIKVIPLDPAMPGKRRKVPALQDEVVFRVTIDKSAAVGPRDDGFRRPGSRCMAGTAMRPQPDPMTPPARPMPSAPSLRSCAGGRP